MYLFFQPAIRTMLTSSEFSGALDLIATSREVLEKDLKGVVAFRHLDDQLGEMKDVIGDLFL